MCFCIVFWAASEGNTRGFELAEYVSQNCAMKCPDVIAIGPCHRSVSVAKRISLSFFLIRIHLSGSWNAFSHARAIGLRRRYEPFPQLLSV